MKAKLHNRFLNILGEKVKIIESDLQGALLGAYLYRERVIQIEKKEIHTPDKMSTLIHEMVHAVFARSGVTQAISNELEEIICENIATMITENFDLKFKNARVRSNKR